MGPEKSKILEQHKPILELDIFAFPELRRSQENFLYALKYYQKFPSHENYELLEKTVKFCNKHHFHAILCKFYEQNKMVMILNHFDHVKGLNLYPNTEVMKCLKN
jgi:hypothetical protein